jgi:toxin ParE1/3/4
MTIRWSEAASGDVKAIYEYIARDKPGEALNQIEELFAAAERLTQFPRMGRAGRRPLTREWVVPPFILVYMLEGDVIHILHVIHGSQNHQF